MAEDFYSQAARQRLAMLDAEKAAHLADLAAHRANSDTESAASVVQALANTEAERQNLLSLHNQYVASQQAPARPELTQEQRNAKPWSQMDFSDSLEMAKQSRYAKNLTADDPHFVAGMREATRRRQRGE